MIEFTRIIEMQFMLYKNLKNHMKNKMIMMLLAASLLSSCKGFLDENPKSFLAPGNTLNNTYGFQTASTGLYILARNELNGWSSTGNMQVGYVAIESLTVGTDVSTQGKQINDTQLRPFEEYTFDGGTSIVRNWWKYYYGFIANCNSIINGAENPNVVWDKPTDKNMFIAEARFFRAFCYRGLTYLYGDAPWVDKIEYDYRNDFTRTPKKELYAKMIADLNFAIEHLPVDPDQLSDGKISKWVAAHLLSEVYILDGQFEKASTTAASVINSGAFKLMDTRFGGKTKEAGDPYSDIFLENNTNRSSGNRETLFVYQLQYNTPGGGDVNVNWSRRSWGPYYSNVPGFSLCDSLGGRSIGQMAPMASWMNSYEAQDMRASQYNLQRDYYYNDPKSPKYGQKAEITEATITAGTLFPTFKKFYFGVTAQDANYSGNAKDWIVFRLSETYLLKAEADIQRGAAGDAADAINAVRGRAKATPITASEATIDFLLDERARELIGEEKRRFTLLRTGKLFERVAKFNARSRDKIKPHHNLWPIPQEVIDANSGAEFPQNPGYAK